MDSATFRKVQTFVDHTPLTVISTIDSGGVVHGAVVYACIDDTQPAMYFMTKTDTQKYKNLSENPQVALTSFSEKNVQTLQAHGEAFIVNDAKIIDAISKKIVRAHMSSEEWLPPIAKLRAGAYVLVGVQLTSARLGGFKGKHIGDEAIFTNL